MWFLKSWIYKGRYGKSPFKMLNFTESFQGECRESVKEKFQDITSKLDHIWTRIELKHAKEKMHASFADILGKRHAVKHPIFTENEIAKSKQNRWLYVFVFFLLIFFESILYSLMANMFIAKQTRKDYPGIELIFGLAFAIIFVSALHFAFLSLWAFFEAKCIVEKEKLEKVELQPFYKKLVISIVIFIIFLVTNVYTGYIRANILEPSSTNSSVFIDKIHGPLLVFSIAITFIVALVMALLEKEISEKSEKYKVFKNWKRQQKEHKVYNTKIKEMLSRCRESKEILIEEYWGIMKDLQRVFEVEVDDDQKALYTELNKEIADNSIDLRNLNDKNYQKYMPVALTRYELFRYGIDADKDIIARLENLHIKVAKIEGFERKNALLNNENEAEIVPGNPSSEEQASHEQ